MEFYKSEEANRVLTDIHISKHKLRREKRIYEYDSDDSVGTTGTAETVDVSKNGTIYTYSSYTMFPVGPPEFPVGPPKPTYESDTETSVDMSPLIKGCSVLRNECNDSKLSPVIRSFTMLTSGEYSRRNRSFTIDSLDSVDSGKNTMSTMSSNLRRRPRVDSNDVYINVKSKNTHTGMDKQTTLSFLKRD